MAFTVTFTDTSTGSPIGWQWNFGDGTPLVYTQNPVHLYSVNGVYSVTLTVIGSGGDHSSVTQLVDVHAPFFTVTTTGAAQTLTVNSWGFSVPTIVDWGDGSTQSLAGTSLRTHVYALANTYTVKVYTPLTVTRFDIRDAKVTLNSTDIKSMSNLLTAIFVGLKGGAINSADFTAWRPLVFQIQNMLAGCTGAINSADLAAWSPDNFALSILPTGYTGTFNSADLTGWVSTLLQVTLRTLPVAMVGAFNSVSLSGWRPSLFILQSVLGFTGTFNSADITAWRPVTFEIISTPAALSNVFNSSDVSAWRPTTVIINAPVTMTGTFNTANVAAWNPTFFQITSKPAAYVITITANGFAAWIAVTTLSMQGNALLQAAVNQILFDLYTAFATRNVSAGTVNVSGTNAAPSGALAAQCPPTGGKNAAYELVNDSCLINPTNKWTTVTTS